MTPLARVRPLLLAGCLLVLALPAAAAAAGPPRGRAAAVTALRRTLAADIAAAGRASGARVVDLTTGETLYAAADQTPRLPASIEKIYTVATALARLGPATQLHTTVLASGTLDPDGTFTGTLYLRGGGDPTFGTRAFDRSAYGGAGATVEDLAAELLAAVPMRAFHGRVVGDESYLDGRRGTPPYRFAAALDIEGELSGLAYDRGFSDFAGTTFQADPPLVAARGLVAALRSAGVTVPRGTATATGPTPPGATVEATVPSPTVAELAALTLAPSDNFLAETLLKDIGAAAGGPGTTAAGAAAVRATVATAFGVHPALEDGSGLSRHDRTSPRDVVTALARLSAVPEFTAALAVAGRTGTLVHRMRGTPAQDRCLGKTGTLTDVSNLAGLCTARDGHTLAFAWLMNTVDITRAHRLQDAMTVALARYDG